MKLEPRQIVRQARVISQLNQQDFAKSLGKSQGVLSRYENGKVPPPSDVIMHCMNIMNTNSGNSDIDQIIAKVRSLHGDQYIKVRTALNTLLDSITPTQ